MSPHCQLIQNWGKPHAPKLGLLLATTEGAAALMSPASSPVRPQQLPFVSRTLLPLMKVSRLLLFTSKLETCRALAAG